MRLDGDFFDEGEVRGGLLGVLTIGGAFLGAVDIAEADAVRLLVLEDFEGVTVEDEDDGAGVVDSEREACSKHADKDYDEMSV